MPLILPSINHLIKSHMLYTNPLKYYQHNLPSQALPAISEVAWKEHVVFVWNVLRKPHNNSLRQFAMYSWWLEKFLAIFYTFTSEIFDWRGQWNSSRESVFDSKYELKVFATLMFSNKISRLSLQGNFWVTKGMLVTKIRLTAFPKGAESTKGFKLSKCPWLEWFFNLTT